MTRTSDKPSKKINDNKMTSSIRDRSQIVIIFGHIHLDDFILFILKPNYLSYDNIMTILLATCVNGLWLLEFHL